MDEAETRQCTACPEHLSPDSRCADDFICVACGRQLNKCAHLPGGLGATKLECAACQLRRELLEIRHLRMNAKA